MAAPDPAKIHDFAEAAMNALLSSPDAYYQVLWYSRKKDIGKFQALAELAYRVAQELMDEGAKY